MNQRPKRNAVIESEKIVSKRKAEVDKRKVKKERKDSATNRYLIEIAQKKLNENITRIDTSVLAQSDYDNNNELTADDLTSANIGEGIILENEYENVREDLEYSFQVEYCQSKNHRMVKGFDINALVEMTLANANLSIEINSYESNLSLIKNDNSAAAVTKSAFSRALIEYFQVSNTTISNQSLLLNLLHNSFGGIANLPVHVKSEINEDNDEQSIQSDSTEDSVEVLFRKTVIPKLTQYWPEHKNKRFFCFNQCQNDCTLFIGNEYADLYHCPKCSHPRYRPCTRRKCSQRNKHDCPHLLEEGIAYKNLYYRSLTLLIYDLVDTKYFASYLSYARLHVDKNTYSDFMDGEVALGHLEDMNNLGHDWIAEKPIERNGTILINLLLSEFYDGGQLFTSKVFDFWPLCIGILNLPAHLRSKIGLGYFLGALYNGKHSETERKLISEFLCEELICLFDGIPHESNGKKFYIQARLVLHVLDTKAAEPVLGLQSAANSKFGCPLCSGATGLYNGKKCVFYGHRNFLPQYHWLRFFGQTGYCCPQGFYDPKNKNQWQNNEVFWNKEREFKNIRKSFFAPHGYTVFSEILDKLNSCRAEADMLTKRQRMIEKRQTEIESICHPCDNNQLTKDGLIDFLLPSRLDAVQSKYEYSWFHAGEFSLDVIKVLFSKHLFYRHFDYRTQRPYRRGSYDQYKADALAAVLLNDCSRAKKKKHVNGVQSLWYYCRLPYADIQRQFTWPFVHAVTGFIVRMTECILGHFVDQKDKPKKRKGSIAVKVIDDADDNDDADEQLDGAVNDKDEHIDEPYDGGAFRPDFSKDEPSFEASKGSIEKVCAWLDCVLLPQGLNDDWDINFRKPKGMKMVQKLKMVSCYWDFIMECLDIDAGYKALFRMFAHDIRQMLSLVIPKNSVQSMQDCVIESVSTWEGMMPAKENYFQVHQLVDLPLFIRYFGPPMGVCELPGERMLSMLKKRKLRMNSGGHSSFGKSVVRKQINHERWIMKRFFNKKPVSVDPHTGNFVYNDRPFFLGMVEGTQKHSKTRSFVLTEFEIENLASTLLNQIERKFDRDPEHMKHSPLYRIFSSGNYFRTWTWVEKLKYVQSRPAMFAADEIKVANSLLDFQPSWHKSACIYGVYFGSRGSNCREVDVPLLDKYYKASPSTSSREWSEKAEYSSWCKYQSQNRRTVIENYAKINAFFKADIGDSTIKDCIIVSLTSFKTTVNALVSENMRPLIPSFSCVDVVAVSGSLVKEYFVGAQDICPTRIAIIPFYDKHRSILIGKGTKKYESEYAKHRVGRDNLPIVYIMLPLTLEKKLYQTDEINKRSFDLYM
jgi:hypothetical protein